MDLLTYGDLESLRSQQHLRPGYGTQHIPGAKTRSQLHCKRYLIMTYTVEFDRLAAQLCIYYFMWKFQVMYKPMKFALMILQMERWRIALCWLASYAAVVRLVPPHKHLLNRAIHSFSRFSQSHFTYYIPVGWPWPREPLPGKKINAWWRRQVTLTELLAQCAQI